MEEKKTFEYDIVIANKLVATVRVRATSEQNAKVRIMNVTDYKLKEETREVPLIVII